MDPRITKIRLNVVTYHLRIRHIHLLPSFQLESFGVDKVVDVHRRMHVDYQRHTKERKQLDFQHLFHFQNQIHFQHLFHFQK